MDIKKSGSQPSVKGPEERFTGTVRIDPLFETTEHVHRAIWTKLPCRDTEQEVGGLMQVHFGDNLPGIGPACGRLDSGFGTGKPGATVDAPICLNLQSAG